MIVDQVLCAAGPVDAVTNQARACRALFHQWGWQGQDYSAVIAAGLPAGGFHRLADLKPQAGHTLLLHYSGWADGLERVFDGTARSLLISHNITPARFFWDHEPVQAVHNELAHDQLAGLIRRVDAVAGVSHYNAEQLRALGAGAPAVIPVLVNADYLGPPTPPTPPTPTRSPSAPPAPTAPPAPDQAPTVIFVGRLVPHKRQDLVIRAFARFRETRPEARLVLVGVPMSPAYGAGLEQLAQRLAPGAVSFHQTISAAELAEHYRRASVFLCLSEHEGFCIPLLEALHFRLPVIARDAGAIAEVLGDAGVLLGEQDGIEVVAELLRILTTDEELAEELRRRGEARLAAYDYNTTAATLRQALEEVAA